MSIRALGRQFTGQMQNRNRPWVPGSPGHPQGQLFRPGAMAKWRPEADLVESARRRSVGEANPAAPWRERWFAHQFPGYDSSGVPRRPPVQGELF